MTPNNFINWVMDFYSVKNKSAAVIKASEITHTTARIWWDWLRMDSAPPPMILLMCLVKSSETAKKRPCGALH